MIHQGRTRFEIPCPRSILENVYPSVEIIYTWDLAHASIVEVGSHVPRQGGVGDRLGERAGDVDFTQAFTAGIISQHLGQIGKHVHHARVGAHRRGINLEQVLRRIDAVAPWRTTGDWVILRCRA